MGQNRVGGGNGVMVFHGLEDNWGGWTPAGTRPAHPRPTRADLAHASRPAHGPNANGVCRFASRNRCQRHPAR